MRGGRIRQGLARIARHRGAPPRSQRAARAGGGGRAVRGGGRPVPRGVPRPSRRRAGRSGAVHAAHRRRPADRPRRLRHEGRPGGDDVRAQGRRGPGRGAGRASCASPTRSPRRSTTARPTRSSRAGAARRLRDHRRADQPAHRRRGQGRARDARRGPRPAAHGSTPWLGDNAILKAHRRLPARSRRCPFSRESSELFDRPSINLARIVGGDAFNKVPDRCRMDVDIRFLPGQDPEEILRAGRSIAGRSR